MIGTSHGGPIRQSCFAVSGQQISVLRAPREHAQAGGWESRL
ncbi:unnamed protein product [Staurois parvus]|uniref:Uncharacterized protein n=1 Tax=Staurois parvus TaxID=386267 RepID=A0ABN9ERN4_9NEOB|nr:unnamed protein product [Staurois parvus]